MELKEFVKGVLTQICEGVVETQKEIEKYDAVVNPKDNRHASKVEYTGIPVSEVVFDVDLIKSGKNENTAGIGVFLGDVGIGGKCKSKTNDETITHIKFSIPIVFPFFDIKQ